MILKKNDDKKFKDEEKYIDWEPFGLFEEHEKNRMKYMNELGTQLSKIIGSDKLYDNNK